MQNKLKNAWSQIQHPDTKQSFSDCFKRYEVFFQDNYSKLYIFRAKPEQNNELWCKPQSDKNGMYDTYGLQSSHCSHNVSSFWSWDSLIYCVYTLKKAGIHRSIYREQNILLIVHQVTLCVFELCMQQQHLSDHFISSTMHRHTCITNQAPASSIDCTQMHHFTGQQVFLQFFGKDKIASLIPLQFIIPYL